MNRLLSLGLLCVSTTWVHAEDWPHWMGPNRDNVWKESGIVEALPKGGPKKLWSTAIAGGYAGPAIANGKVFVTDYVTGDNVKVDNFSRSTFSGTERVLCLDEKTGKELWKYEYPVKYTISYPAGPRCTPTVDGNLVYTLGAEGNLFCFEVATGKMVWGKDLKSEYKTKSALWGFASHPMIDGDKLITLAGGTGSHVIALDKKTGKELWKSQTAPEQGYSPPLLTEAGGKRQLIVPRPDAVVSLDPETGKLYWKVPYDATNGSIIMTPVRYGDYVFVAGYSGKNLLLELNKEKPGATVVWKDKKNHAMSPVNVQPILDQGVLYGFDEKGDLMGVELPSGKRLWNTPEPVKDRTLPTATAFIVKNGDRYFFFTEYGDLVIGTLSQAGFEETSRAKLVEATNVAFGRSVVWCAPAFANKHIYVRNDKEIACFDLSK